MRQDITCEQCPRYTEQYMGREYEALLANKVLDTLTNIYDKGVHFSVLGQDKGYTVNYRPLPPVTPEGKGPYLTVYLESNPNTNGITSMN